MSHVNSVAEPAPDVRGPGANSSSRRKKRLRLQTKKGRLQAAPAPDTKIFDLSSEKCNY